LKTHIPDKTTWVGFLQHLKDSLQRNLTKEEIAEAMKVYITGKSVEEYLERARERN
jgi:hypothetical protein